MGHFFTSISGNDSLTRMTDDAIRPDFCGAKHMWRSCWASNKLMSESTVDKSRTFDLTGVYSRGCLLHCWLHRIIILYYTCMIYVVCRGCRTLTELARSHYSTVYAIETEISRTFPFGGCSRLVVFLCVSPPARLRFDVTFFGRGARWARCHILPILAQHKYSDYNSTIRKAVS